MQPELIERYRKNAAIRWVQTFSGGIFYPTDPRPDCINIRDIAHALGKKCRFNGHCLVFYSVAEHSVYVSRNVPREFALWGLLHDAAEAYLPDVPRPIKPILTNFSELEKKIMAAVIERFELDPPEEPEIVKRIDNAILADEQQQIMSDPPEDWFLPEPPLGVRIESWLPHKAIGEFLIRFAELTE